MKKYLLLLFTVFLFSSCKKENVSTSLATPSSTKLQAGARVNVISSTTTEYYLDFNPYVYCNEFWKEGTTTYGSCFAAAVAIVEGHLSGASSISRTAVSERNASMIRDNPYSMSRFIYILSSIHLKAQFRKEHFTINFVSGYTRKGAINGMINALKNNKWIITIAEYWGGGLAHAYPVYYLKIVKNTDGSVNEYASTIKVIDTYGCETGTPYYDTYAGTPQWDRMYPKEYSLKEYLDKMNSAVPSVYSTFEVSR